MKYISRRSIVRKRRLALFSTARPAQRAAIIAEAARSMPHTLRSLRLADEQLAELTMLCGFDDDLAAQVTQTSNRIRGLLTQIHPALERVLGPRLDHPAALDLLERYPPPAALAGTSEKTRANRLTKLAPRMGKGLAAEIVQALSERTSRDRARHASRHHRHAPFGPAA